MDRLPTKSCPSQAIMVHLPFLDFLVFFSTVSFRGTVLTNAKNVLVFSPLFYPICWPMPRKTPWLLLVYLSPILINHCIPQKPISHLDPGSLLNLYHRIRTCDSHSLGSEKWNLSNKKFTFCISSMSSSPTPTRPVARGQDKQKSW